MKADAAVERHDGMPPGEDEIAARMRAEGLSLWVPRTSSTSRDQAILVDQATGASLPSDAVLLKIDRFG